MNVAKKNQTLLLTPNYESVVSQTAHG